MSDALRYEWVRIKTLRSTWWLTGLAILVSGLLGLTAIGAETPYTVNDYADGLVGGPLAIFVLFMSILLGLIGVFSLGHEYRYNTIRPTLNALPRRTQLLGAKTLVVILYVGLIGIICQLVRYCVMLLILGPKLTDLGLFPGGMGRVWLGTILYPIVFALCGLALAGLFRSMPTAIVLVIVMPVIAENIVRGLLGIGSISILQHIGKLMPFTAGTQIMRIDTTNSDINHALPGPWTGALIFTVFMLILMGLCWMLFEKRDA